jgi:hypothetical protein
MDLSSQNSTRHTCKEPQPAFHTHSCLPVYLLTGLEGVAPPDAQLGGVGAPKRVEHPSGARERHGVVRAAGHLRCRLVELGLCVWLCVWLCVCVCVRRKVSEVERKEGESGGDERKGGRSHRRPYSAAVYRLTKEGCVCARAPFSCQPIKQPTTKEPILSETDKSLSATSHSYKQPITNE